MTIEQLRIINLAVRQCAASSPLLDVRREFVIPFEGGYGVILSTGRGREYGLASPDEVTMMLNFAEAAECSMQISASDVSGQIEFLFL